MKKKFLVAGMLGAVLAFGVTVIGCDDGNINNGSTNNDTWMNITDFDLASGTWAGTHTRTRTLQEFNGDNSFEIWDPAKEEFYGAIVVNSFVNEILGFVGHTQTTGTYTITENHTAVFSGGNIETAWDTIKTVYLGIGVVNDAGRSITYTYNGTTNQAINLEAVNAAGIQVNSSGTSMRVPANAFGPGDPSGERIFTKQ